MTVRGDGADADVGADTDEPLSRSSSGAEEEVLTARPEAAEAPPAVDDAELVAPSADVEAAAAAAAAASASSRAEICWRVSMTVSDTAAVAEVRAEVSALTPQRTVLFSRARAATVEAADWAAADAAPTTSLAAPAATVAATVALWVTW